MKLGLGNSLVTGGALSGFSPLDYAPDIWYDFSIEPITSELDTLTDLSGNLNDADKLVIGGNVEVVTAPQNCLNLTSGERYQTNGYTYPVASTVFTVNRNTGTANAVWGTHETTAAAGGLIAIWSDTKSYVYTGNGNLSATGQTDDIWYYNTVIYDNPEDDTHLRRSGTLLSTKSAVGAGTPAARGEFLIGAIGSTRMTGKFAEIILYPSVLDSDQIDIVEAYLVTKYGL